MIKSRKQMYIVIGVFALVLMLGTVTYAFFNYTRTGTANTIRTGRISFNTSQSNTLNLTNVFPISATDAENANLDQVFVRIQGDTSYAGGEEFEISIVDVNNTIGSGQNTKTIPINYIATYSATPVQEGNPNVIGTNSDSYFTERGQSSPVYQLKATGEATNGEQVLIGFIPKDIVVDGTLTIKAYLDSSKIVISDTYNDGNTPTDNMGTPASFGENKTVLTTTEWNDLQNSGTPLSFKIKAVSQEGTWVEEPLPDYAIPTCPGCKFVYFEQNESYYTSWNTENETPTIFDDYSDDYHDIIIANEEWGDVLSFIGVILNENSEAQRVFACSTYNNNPFCLEVTNESPFNSNNVSFVQNSNLWNGNCDVNYSDNYASCYFDNDSSTGNWLSIAENGIEISFPNSYSGLLMVYKNGRFGIYSN